MVVHAAYVYPSKLISPINGYECRVITRQNIKQFGFDSIEELHLQYPDFPTKCLDTEKKQINELLKAGQKRGKRQRIENRIAYETNPKLCGRCNGPIPYDKRHNEYCCHKCSQKYSRPQTEETKQRIRDSINKRNLELGKYKPKYHKKSSTPRSGEIFKCYCCNNSTYVIPSKIRKDMYYACNKPSCKKFVTSIRRRLSGLKGGLIGGKVSAAKQVRRSKQEKELYNLLSPLISNLDNNKPIANGWDADILLMDQKIAILWNGPWHYREMGLKNHSLEQVVNRDCIKIHEFEKIGWKVLIYQDNEWTPETAMVDVLINVNS